MFDKAGEPVSGMCDVGVLSLAKNEGAVKVEALGLKLMDAIAVEKFVSALSVVASATGVVNSDVRAESASTAEKTLAD